MPGEIAYIPENVGDWGIPEAVAGGSYGTDSLEMADGIRVFFRFWKTPHAEDPVLVFIHGLGAHTGWFIDMGNQLNQHGLNVYMDDHRAFGRSGGVRGHVRRGTIYIDDLKRFLAEVQKRHPDAPLFLCGHSMGGMFATYLATQFSPLKGLILINPWIRDRVKVKTSALVQTLAGGITGSDRIVVRDVDTDQMTLVPEAGRLLSADSYWVRNQSGSFLTEVTRMRLGALRAARRVSVPALVIQGEGDRTLVQKATRNLYLQLGSRDKTWKTYAGLAHDFEFDPGRAVLDGDIADWILRHSGQA
jgi:alpha-beta hydrolase superfamily lysophospholipase